MTEIEKAIEDILKTEYTSLIEELKTAISGGNIQRSSINIIFPDVYYDEARHAHVSVSDSTLYIVFDKNMTQKFMYDELNRFMQYLLTKKEPIIKKRIKSYTFENSTNIFEYKAYCPYNYIIAARNAIKICISARCYSKVAK